MARVPQSPTTDFTSTTLNGAINSSTTSVTVNDASTMAAPCYIVVDREDNNGNATPTLREVMYVSAISSNTLTVTRGVDNSTARSHNDSALVEPMITVGFWDDFYDAYDLDHTAFDGSHDITKVAMLSGSTVQTLASKILSSPTITSPTITSPSMSYASLTSVGLLTMAGDLILRSAATPAQTAAGALEYDSTRNIMTMGDGSATKEIPKTAEILAYEVTPTSAQTTTNTSFEDMAAGTKTFYIARKSNLFVNAHANIGNSSTVAYAYIRCTYDTGGADTEIGQQGYQTGVADAHSASCGGMAANLSAATYTVAMQKKVNAATGSFFQPQMSILVVPTE